MINRRKFLKSILPISCGAVVLAMDAFKDRNKFDDNDYVDDGSALTAEMWNVIKMDIHNLKQKIK